MPSLEALSELAAGFSPQALKKAVADGLRSVVNDRERGTMAVLIATWLQRPEGPPPPLGDDVLDAIHRQLTKYIN